MNNRYSKIRKMDISNGPGIRVSIFLQGCEFHCKNCFNPETHDFDGGKEFTDRMFDKMMEVIGNPRIVGLSILGGEPLHPRNIGTTKKIVKRMRKEYPDKTIWIWSGYTFENYISKIDFLEDIDVIVDGQFIEEKKDLKLEYMGSSNQRAIDIKKTLEHKQIVLYEK